MSSGTGAGAGVTFLRTGSGVKKVTPITSDKQSDCCLTPRKYFLFILFVFRDTKPIVQTHILCKLR